MIKSSRISNQQGVAHILILVAALGLIAFIIIAQIADFRDNFFASLFPKPISEAARGGRPKPTTNPVVYTPMRVVLENYQGVGPNEVGGDCIHVDDFLNWEATGSLNPGESFVFTPQKLSCEGEVPAISAVLSWEGSQLELTSVIPYGTAFDDDAEQGGKTVVAPNVGNTSQLCMFPYPSAVSTKYNYSFKVTNIGNQVANNIKWMVLIEMDGFGIFIVDV